MARIRRGAFLAPVRDCAKRRPSGVSSERVAHGAGACLIADLGAGSVTGCVASDGTALVSMESSVRTLVAVSSTSSPPSKNSKVAMPHGGHEIAPLAAHDSG